MKLKKISVLSQFILTLLTAGFYVPLWFMTSKKSLEEMHSEIELNFNIILMAVVYFGMRYLIFLALLTKGNLDILLTLEIMSNDPIGLLLAFLLIPQALKIRRMLLRGFKNLTISWIFTLLFGIFYLQYKINSIEKSTFPISVEEK